MVQRPVCLFAAFALAVVAFAGTAAAQDQALWSASTGGDMTSLRYGGVNQTDYPPLLLSCFNAMGIAVLDIREIGKVTAGQKLPLKLSAGGTTVSLTGTATVDRESGKVYVEVSAIKVKPLLQVLKAKGSVAVMIGDHKMTLNDAGRASALKEFADRCEVE